MAAREAAPAIELTEVVKRYGEVVAVAGLNLQVAAGECLGFLGPNGAGKTTSLEMMEGISTPTSGSIRILGRSWAEDERWLRPRIGLALQETQFEERLTVLETIRLFRSFSPRGLDPREALAQVRLGDQAGKRVGVLSGGQRQRLALAVGLCSAPEILFLDEPTSGLDPQARRDLWEIIEELKRTGTTLVLTTHYMDEVEQLCGRIVVIDQGKVIADGSPASLRREHGGQHIIEVATTPPLEAEALARLPGVRRVMTHGEALALSVEDVRHTLPEVIALGTSGGRRLVHLAVRAPSLDDVFLQLTGRSLQAGAAP